MPTWGRVAQLTELQWWRHRVHCCSNCRCIRPSSEVCTWKCELAKFALPNVATCSLLSWWLPAVRQAQSTTVRDHRIKAGVEHLSASCSADAGSRCLWVHFRLRAVTGELPVTAASLVCCLFCANFSYCFCKGSRGYCCWLHAAHQYKAAHWTAQSLLYSVALPAPHQVGRDCLTGWPTVAAQCRLILSQTLFRLVSLAWQLPQTQIFVSWTLTWTPLQKLGCIGWLSGKIMVIIN